VSGNARALFSNRGRRGVNWRECISTRVFALATN